MALICLSANVWAQSTGSAPFPGAIHTYTVTAEDAANNTLTWDVVDASNFSVQSTVATIGTPVVSGNLVTVQITWANPVTSPATYYYVQVTEADGTCSNTKSFKVLPVASTFDLAITSTTGGCYNSPVNVSYDASNDPVYTHGAATITYTVTPTDVALGQGYEFTISPTAITGWTIGAPSITSASGATVNINASTGKATVSDNKEVVIEYDVTKDATTKNGDPLNIANFSLEVTLSNGKTTNGVIALGTTTGQTATVDVARPNTGDISAID